MAEIAFEALMIGLESIRGTAVAPTHYANMTGTLVPRIERYAPDEARGSLAARYRSKTVRTWGEFSAEGPLDVNLLPVFLNMAATGDMTSQPSTPGGATNSRLWAFVPDLTSDDLKTATLWWGDPNVQVFRGTYGHVNEITIRNDASGTDGATMAVSGRTQKPDYPTAVINAATAADPVQITTTAAHGFVDGDTVYITGITGMTEINDREFIVDDASGSTFTLTGEDGTGHTAYSAGGSVRKLSPVFPAQLTAPLITGGDMAIWLDSGGDPIGTTSITGRVISAEHVLPVNWSTKYLAAGAGSTGSFSRLGRAKRSLTTRIVMELIDLDQFDLFDNDTSVKLRVRHNGTLIEGSLYYYVEVDTYGPLVMTDWGELEGTNRTIAFEIVSEYDTTLGADWRIAVQNIRTTL